MTDARSALEFFIIQILDQTGYKSNKSFKRNIDELRKQRLIEEPIMVFISETIYEWIYRYISNKAVHERVKINLIDARYIVRTIEVTLDYLINRLLIFRV